ncbi:MAG: response regulator [Candidatus Methylomirabilales bacterium]
MDPIRILLADDQTLFRESLANFLTRKEGLKVVGMASDGKEAVEKARELLPDLILMDIYMPELNGFEATKQIKAELPRVKIVILTVAAEDRHVFEAVKAGAEGYLLKDIKPEELLEILRGISRGEPPISRSTAAKILTEFARTVREELRSGTGLTTRERQILEFLARGQANKEIAAELSISEATVKKHLGNIMEKLHLENRVQAAIYAVKHGLVPPTDA